MIYLCSALYSEGEPFIKIFNLKKDTSITKFQIFKNKDITLLITGCGKIKAAITLTYLLTKMKAKHKDLLINIGACGSKLPQDELGTCFLCNKITDHDTGFSYYPDIIFKHPFKENSIETFSYIVKNKDDFSNSLCDMESSSIYEAASVFLEPHEIFFLKIVSDHLDDSENINKEDLKTLVNRSVSKIIKWINFLLENYSFDNDILSSKDIALYENVCENLKFSASMKNELKKLLTFKKLENKEFSLTLLNYKDINCSSKKEGKKYLEEIKSKLI